MTSAEQLAALQENEQTRSERLRPAQLRYDDGVSNYLEVLDAQHELFTTRQNVVQVRRAQLANAEQLDKALGGGDYGREKSAAFQKLKSD